jgi:hypothetical protein
MTVPDLKSDGTGTYECSVDVPDARDPEDDR